MNRIVLEEYKVFENLIIYTIRFEKEKKNETDKFFEKYLNLGYLEDLQIIKSWLNTLSRRGARQNYFRFENSASAGPRDSSSLRIYCIRCHENMIILGGGGLKKGATAQDGAETKFHFELMNKLDGLFIKKLKEGEIQYTGDMLLAGDLTFDL